MSKVLWHNTMSVDGFVARPGDDMTWLSKHLGPNETVDFVLPQIGALLIGARTYGLAEEGKPYGGAISVPQFVVTHAEPDRAAPGFRFLGGTIADVVNAAKDAAGDKYVAILGQDIGHQVLDAGLLDEILVHVAPVLLGEGVRMFAPTGGNLVELERIRVTDSPSVTDLWFSVSK